MDHLSVSTSPSSQSQSLPKSNFHHPTGVKPLLSLLRRVSHPCFLLLPSPLKPPKTTT